MIYLLQNSREYDYDVRAIALTFFERTKIKEVTVEQWYGAMEETLPEASDVFVHIDYSEKHIEGCLCL